MTTNNFPDKERVTIILHSGSYDRASYALSLALVALASGMEVHILLTFEGLVRFTKGHLMKMAEETALMVRASIERGLASGGMQSLESHLTDAKRLGLKIYACPNAMASLNIAQGELIDEVDNIMGLAAFLRLARTAIINWYI
ncbi:MAG: DsrE/DsrF/DrsH-like family protein [Chloroflexi bacterium]|nr:DsrE/DsrF/DrsH-like family protein [Chloroflexota bacterium]